jgi:hypothetical protein
MPTGTIESLTSPPTDREAFIAEASQVIDAHFDDAPETATADTSPAPNETPAPNPSETPNSSVEPSDANAPETVADPANPTPGEATSNDATGANQQAKPVLPPASWQPDDVARQLAQDLGVPDEVVRDIRSQDEFVRVLRVANARRMNPAAPSPPATPTEPTALEKFLADDVQDPDTRAAVKQLVEQNAQLAQQLQQISQGTQAQQQAAQEQQVRQVEQQFDSVLDGLGYDLFGKSDSLSDEQRDSRASVYGKLWELAQRGLVKDVSPVSVEQAFMLAQPEKYKEQLRRTLAEAARSQANSNISAGRSAPTPRSSPTGDLRDDPELLKAAKELGLSP